MKKISFSTVIAILVVGLYIAAPIISSVRNEISDRACYAWLISIITLLVFIGIILKGDRN